MIMTAAHILNMIAYVIFLISANGLWMIEEPTISKKRLNRPLAIIWACALVMILTQK